MIMLCFDFNQFGLIFDSTMLVLSSVIDVVDDILWLRVIISLVDVVFQYNEMYSSI